MPRSDAHLTEDELLQQFRKTGDTYWLGQVLQMHTVLLLGVAMKYLKEAESAADAVQTVFLKALTHFPQDEMRNVKGWLYILVRNYCLQLLREKVYHAPVEAIDTSPAIDPETPDEAAWEKEYTLQQLEAGLARLPAEQRTVIDLFYLQRKSYAEVQSLTGYTFGQVKSYIQNGKRALRLLLQSKRTV
ncbi:MAG: sigma-70 family RNA polymerase sigma factor [Sphingobacteriales bacterium]|nr:MAG: sigma-70 family RNA polymerase sigma factor [Sphingobacteriales bacterium]